jgi:2-keto-4-pentenoate hydratase/2-oxohepta-3-ene-1,7-dioic acid hydratase in catechol pathway
MKLPRYGDPGRERPATLDAAGSLWDLSNPLADFTPAVLIPEAPWVLSSTDINSLPLVEGMPRIGPCLGCVGKIVAVGLNYADHAAESHMAIPSEPIISLKPASSISGPYDPIRIPPGSQKTDWEVELGVVIGRPAKRVSREAASEHIAGFCIFNDVSERSYQLERGGTWDKGKGCDSFAPLGPCLVTSDEIADPQNLDLWLEVDGHRYQSGTTRTMIFDVDHLMSYISHFMSLQSGDIIITGTPPGVGLGQKPPIYLNAGQSVRLGITGLGVQQHHTMQEA